MSKLFATAYINWFDYELEMELVFANSREEAMVALLVKKEFDIDGEELNTIEQIKKFAFDGDCMVDAIEIGTFSNG